MTGVVLYGPPASGKSTVTATLTKLDPRFVLLRKLKAGTWNGGEYEFVSIGRLAELRAAGRLLVETHRYGNVYAVDRKEVERMTRAGLVPVVHMGNVGDVRRLAETASWLLVMLWASREVCERRCRQRGDLDTAMRMRAWDETFTELRTQGEDLFPLRLRDERAQPSDMARQIADAYQGVPMPMQGHHA